ncbi:MAG: hypothetical protein R2741_06100 [Methanolobus sp.]
MGISSCLVLFTGCARSTTKEFTAEIKQSTVSTYLSRMFRKNLLERRGNGTRREYRYIGDEQESQPVVDEIVEMPEMPVNHRFFY